MEIDTLVTTLNKTEDQILSLVLFNKLKGHVLIGDQCDHDGRKDLVIGDCLVTILFSLDRGVSKSRNMLLRASRAEYVTFADDDIHFSENYLQLVSEKIAIFSFPDAIRFNCESLNKERPISQLQKSGKIVSFRQIREYGVWGIFFRRDFLLNRSLFFPEDMGPGTKFRCGEDTFFLHSLFKEKFSFHFSPERIAYTPQFESTWFISADSSALVSEGYSYGRSFPFFALCLFGCYHVLKHRQRFPNVRYLQQLQLFFSGGKSGRLYNKNRKRTRK